LVQRIITELESGRKWDENWGTLFSGGAPNDYKERVEYLKEQLRSTQGEKSTKPLPKYGVGAPFKEIPVGKTDFRRRKMFGQPDPEDA
jgi:hypothetical protein